MSLTSSPPLVSRTDPAAGIRETIGFFGSKRAKMFGVLSTPIDRSPVAGAVICSPILAEFLRNYRKEVLLARTLATLGWAVQRFHYRGTGNSDGHWSDFSFETMLADTETASEWLTGRTNVSSISFVGTRVGALVAAGVASQKGGDRLVLWDPVTDGSRYLRETFRWRLMRDLKRGGSSVTSTRGLVEVLEKSGEVDVVGYSLTRLLYETLTQRTLLQEAGESARPVLIVQLGRNADLRPDLSAVVQALMQRGFHVQGSSVQEQEGWWLPGLDRHPEKRRRAAAALVRTTVDWLESGERLRDEK